MIGLITDVISHAILSRIIGSRSHLRIQFFSFGIGALVSGILLILILGFMQLGVADRLGYFMLHMIVYATFGFVFFNMVNANISSLRVRILKEYLVRDPTPIPLSELYRIYSAAEMLSSRLVRLETGKQIECRNGRCYLMKRGIVWIGKFFSGMRLLLLLNQAPNGIKK